MSVAIFSLIIQSCTNNLNLNLGNNQVAAPPPSEGTTSGTPATFTLSRVIKNTINPSSVLDLIGDGSGTFGALCISTNTSGGSSSSADTVCECSFEYSSSTHPNQHVFTPVTYHELNMVRCSYSSIPVDVTSLKVSLHLISADTYSNAVTLNMTTTGTAIDVTNPESFIQPTRFQCRDIVDIKNFLDGGVYDPFQSEDVHLSYPLNFYASNLGNAINQYVASKNSSWNCPPILNPQNYLTANALLEYQSYTGVNMTIYAKAPLPGGGKLIYPPDGSIDRSTFYLAKQPAGVFSVPVNALMAPNLVTSTGDTAAPPLGYGARPVPVGTGTGQETCDTSVSIPVGYHWMKLWLFRAGLAQRHFLTSPSVQKLGSLICNPGNWPQDASHNPVFSQCDKALTNPDGTSNGTGSFSMADVSDSSQPLADRLTDTSFQCFRMINGSTTCSAGSRPGPSCSSSFDFSSIGHSEWKTDLWTALDPLASAISLVGCGANTVIDPMGLCNGTTKKTAATPITFDVSTQDIDKADGAARFDYIFVVSPPSVNTKDMQAGNSASLPYQPWRFKTAQDCLSSDPDLASPGDCLASNAITNYGLKLHDVGENGDPAGDSSSRPGVFPVCVLQPDAQ